MQRQHVSLYIKLFFSVTLISIIMGGLASFFLNSLTLVNNIRLRHNWLLYLLPIGGMITRYCYLKYDKMAAEGVNLVLKRARGHQNRIPIGMLPLALFGTLLTHLLGGSAGREGTSVQMGGAVAEAITTRFGLDRDKKYQRLLMMTGIAAGFSATFGTPLAGTFFAYEAPRYRHLPKIQPLLIIYASFLSNMIGELVGATHRLYPAVNLARISLKNLLSLVILGILAGIVAFLFTFSLTMLKKVYHDLISKPILISAIGAVIFIFIITLFKLEDYQGLSLQLFDRAFSAQSSGWDFLKKLMTTVLTLAAGFQGGEVTPLFEIGASLGNVLVHQGLTLSITTAAACGFIAVFASAANIPITGFIMGIELFGWGILPYLFIVIPISYLISTSRTIYTSQLKPL